MCGTIEYHNGRGDDTVIEPFVALFHVVSKKDENYDFGNYGLSYINHKETKTRLAKEKIEKKMSD